jgi:hypothetical protein
VAPVAALVRSLLRYQGGEWRRRTPNESAKADA